MSNAIFPTFVGLKWGASRTPMFKTAVRESSSGREFRTRFQLYPRYAYKLSYEVLRETTGFTELRSLMGFFNARQGSFDTFLFTDPDDNAVVAQAFGVGNASTTTFQLVRTWGSFAEPVYDVNSAPLIYINGTLKTLTTDYTIGSTGIVTFTVAPAAAAVLTWTGSFYWRVRFKEDKTEFSQFLQKLWEVRSIDLVTMKP